MKRRPTPKPARARTPGRVLATAGPPIAACRRRFRPCRSGPRGETAALSGESQPPCLKQQDWRRLTGVESGIQDKRRLKNYRSGGGLGNAEGGSVLELALVGTWSGVTASCKGDRGRRPVWTRRGGVAVSRPAVGGNGNTSGMACREIWISGCKLCCKRTLGTIWRASADEVEWKKDEEAANMDGDPRRPASPAQTERVRIPDDSPIASIDACGISRF